MLTSKGRAALGDTERLWRAAARDLLTDREFPAALGELTVALLCTRDTVASSELDGVLAEVAHEVGWRSADTGDPPDEREIGWAWHQTTGLLRALDLLSTGGGWQDRSYGLTSAGRAVALECLHHRATGPRSSPWG